MDKKKLKEKLHEYIDNLEDENALQMLQSMKGQKGKILQMN